MKQAISILVLVISFFCFSKSIRILGRLYSYFFLIIEYDLVEQEGAYIEIKRDFGSIFAIDKRVFPNNVPWIFHQCESGRKVSKVLIEGKWYIQKDFVEKGFWKIFFFSSKGLNFWNSGWRMQGNVETIKPALFYSKIDRFRRISTVIYPFEGERMAEAVFNDEQKNMDQNSLREIEKGLKKSKMYHGDLMIWNFIQINGKGLKVIDLEDLIRFPNYSLLFLQMHERDRKQLNNTKSAYQQLVALQMPQ